MFNAIMKFYEKLVNPGHEVKTWQIWYPKSGPLGGVIFGSLPWIILSVVSNYSTIIFSILTAMFVFHVVMLILVTTISFRKESQRIKNIKNNQSGFTLIEVMIVVAVLGLIASIVIPAVNGGGSTGNTRYKQLAVQYGKQLVPTAQVSASCSSDGKCAISINGGERIIEAQCELITSTCGPLNVVYRR